MKNLVLCYIPFLLIIRIPNQPSSKFNSKYLLENKNFIRILQNNIIGLNPLLCLRAGL